MTKLRNYPNYTKQILCEIFRKIINQNSYLKHEEFHWKSSAQKCAKRFYEIICNLHIFAFIVCVDLVTPVPSWRHKVVAMHVTRKTVHIFYNAQFLATRNLRADIGFVMYQNEIIHVIRGFKHEVPCIVRSEELRGHSETSVLRASCTDVSECPLRASNLTNARLRASSLTLPSAPFVPPISQCTVHEA